MKKLLLSSLLLLIWSCFIHAFEFDVGKNHHYRLIKDRLNEHFDPESVNERLSNTFDNFITGGLEKINILGCDFNNIEVKQENINAILNYIDFYKNYDQELKKYHLSLNEFNRLYYFDEPELSDSCINFSYKYIIQLNNHELMIPYDNHLIFYKPLSDEDENKINHLNNNEQCLESKRGEMEWTDTCYYKDMSILNVYEAMSLNPYYIFRSKLKVGENFLADYEDKSVDMEYKWSGKNKLTITQYFEGGTTSYTFIYQNNKTKLITVYSAD